MTKLFCILAGVLNEPDVTIRFRGYHSMAKAVWVIDKA